jgi:hypothetical protein
MTWSLAIQNGDLALSGSDYTIVTGEDKLIQDLTCYILERLGTDPNHPDYGSILNGGVDGSGTVIPSMIGVNNNTIAQSRVQGELQRILLAYQNMQLARAKSDIALYGKTTFSRGEVLLSVDSFTMQSTLDTLSVIIGITTGNNTSVTLNIPLPQASS